MKVDHHKVAPDNWTEAYAMLVNIGAKLYTHGMADEDLSPHSRAKVPLAKEALEVVKSLVLELSDAEQEREPPPPGAVLESFNPDPGTSPR